MKLTVFFLLFATVATMGYPQDHPCVDANGKWGYIDKTGKEIIPFKYDDAYSFSEGLARVKLKGKWGYIDKAGKEIIPFKYDDAYSFSEDLEGLACVKLNGKWGYINTAGKEIIPCKYQTPIDYKGIVFSEDLALVQLNGKWGFIGKTGKEVIPFKYDNASYPGFSEGLAGVQLNGKYGYIDKNDSIVIPIKYSFASSFSEGLAGVYLNDKGGYINKNDNVAIPFKYRSAGNFIKGVAYVKVSDKEPYIYIDKYENVILNTGTSVLSNALGFREAAIDLFKQNNSFSYFAKSYVEAQINEWQKKGEFEKTADWQARVNDNTRNEKVKQLLKDAEREFIAKSSKNKELRMSLATYDADNEVFLVKNDMYGDMLVRVPTNEAQGFKGNWDNLQKTPRYFIENDRLALSEVSFKMPNGKTYQYSNKASLNYAVAQIDYNFDPINIDIAAAGDAAPKGRQNIGTVNVQAGTKSDVALNIPSTGIKQEKTFAVIIANENYQKEAQVVFAKNDGAVFKEYCIKTLGIPEKNIRLVTDATLNNIRGEVNWVSNVAQAYSGEANIIFYYAGHGVPDESSKSAYLLPVDGYGSDVTTGYKLDDLYAKLGGLPAKTVTVFMDACFSGAQRSGDMLASARGVAIKASQGKPSGNMVVFSAAQGDETAYPYYEKGHGLFTYFLLKKLQETKGEASFGELNNYITTNVKQQSIVVNNKSQTPTVTPSASLTDWEKLKLK